MFCMFLRKHLSGARLSGIRQLPMERWAEFVFDCTDEMGYPVQKKLVAELMAGPATCICWTGRGVFWTACGASVWTIPPGPPCRD